MAALACHSNAAVAGRRSTWFPEELLPDDRSVLWGADRVPGGMGSWTDNGFSDKATRHAYETATDQLYKVIVETIRAAANSMMAPGTRPR